MMSRWDFEADYEIRDIDDLILDIEAIVEYKRMIKKRFGDKNE